jgi:alkylation response protein AidB-like acyl-CoA dehydrogenase
MNILTRSDPVGRARELAGAIAAAADAIERTQRIPEPLLSQTHAARLWRMFLPRALSGDEAEPWIYLQAIEELARHDGSLAWNVFVANSATLIAPCLEAETMHTIFGDPRTIVAWGPPNACRATAAPGGYRVSGEWAFASGCRQANWMGVHVQVEEADGTLRLNAAGRPTLRTLLFPAEHAVHVENWNPIGMRGTASEGYRLDDLFVPEAFSSTREDPSLRRIPGRLYAFPQQTLYPVGVAGVAIGLARAMLEALVALATRKAPRGLGRMADSATVQALVGRLQARLDAGRAYAILTLQDVWAVADETGTIDVPTRGRVRLACAQAIQEAIAVADATFKAAGVDAIFPGSPFERRFRDMHTLSQQIQSRDAHFEAVGRILLGIMPEGTFW